MNPPFIDVARALGVLLVVLGISLSLWSAPIALVVTGAFMILAAGIAQWYENIKPEVPATATESS